MDNLDGLVITGNNFELGVPGVNCWAGSEVVLTFFAGLCLGIALGVALRYYFHG